MNIELAQQKSTDCVLFSPVFVGVCTSCGSLKSGHSVGEWVHACQSL